MSDSYGAASVDSTADVIIADLTKRRTVIIKNVGSNPVYLGTNSSVADTTGWPLNPQGSLEINFKFNKRGSAIYGICSSGLSTSVRYLLFDE